MYFAGIVGLAGAGYVIGSGLASPLIRAFRNKLNSNTNNTREDLIKFDKMENSFLSRVRKYRPGEDDD